MLSAQLYEVTSMIDIKFLQLLYPVSVLVLIYQAKNMDKTSIYHLKGSAFVLRSIKPSPTL
jgi:hypothetical protein